MFEKVDPHSAEGLLIGWEANPENPRNHPDDCDCMDCDPENHPAHLVMRFPLLREKVRQAQRLRRSRPIMRK